MGVEIIIHFSSSVHFFSCHFCGQFIRTLVCSAIKTSSARRMRQSPYETKTYQTGWYILYLFNWYRFSFNHRNGEHYSREHNLPWFARYFLEVFKFCTGIRDDRGRYFPGNLCNRSTGNFDDLGSSSLEEYLPQFIFTNMLLKGQNLSI